MTEKMAEKNGISAVLNHLLFHKSLIDEEDVNTRIKQYMELVTQLEAGAHLTIKNPFEKSIALAFELVIQHKFDPWHIDLIKFSRLYLDAIKNEKDIDFITAGRLIFMAWSILKMQTDEVLAIALQNDEERHDEKQDLLVDFFQYNTAEDFDYTTYVLKAEHSPITPAVRRYSSRPVTLMELINAFDIARKDAELRLKNAELRRKKGILDIEFGKKVHREDLCEDICMTWKRILAHNDHPVKLLDICNKKVDDFVSVIFAVLFLVQLQKIKVWQDNLPYGDIYIQKIAAELDKKSLKAGLSSIFKKDKKS
jgi:segregation and condensation protein A